MANESEKEREEAYRRLSGVLAPMDPFVAKHPELSYIEFDYYATHELTLFTIEPSLDFEALKSINDKILSALPYLKRIFAKPIIVLKDSDDVLPVETVHIINQATMLHLANHSENVENITRKGVTPRKLLTRIYEDDYSIYENIIFCNLVDEILHYVRHTMASLRDLVYANEVLEFNLLERVNHLNYFLTIGKLHTGYIRDFDKYYAIGKSLYVQLQSLLNALQSRLQRPVYQKNMIRNRRLPLKKTNIFLMQKDYHQVYRLYKWMEKRKLVASVEETPVSLEPLKKEYFNFVEMLVVFAIGNFNFEMAPNAKMNLENLKAEFHFKKWTATIETLGSALLLSVKKDQVYRIKLLPSLSFDKKEKETLLSDASSSEETLICTPFEEEGDDHSLFLSVENIESFRRIQQLLLRAMVYADTERKDCPFCLGDLQFHPKASLFECDTCRTQIKQAVCPETGKPYFYTEIAGRKKSVVLPADYSKNDEWLYKRKVESLLYFRNITKITAEGEVVCPQCGHVHKLH